jgi:heat shock protein HtpX
MFLQIASNKRWSAVLLFACLGVLAAFGWALDAYIGLPDHIALFAAMAIAVIMGLVSYFGGDNIILASASARQVTHDDQPQLFNVVEEVAIACGEPVPRVFLIDDPSPNAFATGRDPHHASIAVTRGLLDKLNRNELQGVVAHEMSHVRNYDILFMTIVTVMVGTIALLSDVFWRGRAFRLGGRGKGGAVVLILALIVLILAPIAARLVQLAASRKREFLADASAAVITRYPAGLASALRKLVADPLPLDCANRATQSLYIVNPLKGSGGTSLWDTHPPLEERIARLEKMAYLNPDAGADASHSATPATPAPAASTALPLPLPLPPPVGTAALAGGVAVAAATPVAASALAPAPAVAPTPTNQCPRCGEKLRRGGIAGRKLGGCGTCGGLWIGEDDLAALLQSAPRKLQQADDAFANRVGTGWRSFADKRCPACGDILHTEPLKQDERVIIDRCASGHGVWFDDGEMAALVKNLSA